MKKDRRVLIVEEVESHRLALHHELSVCGFAVDAPADLNNTKRLFASRDMDFVLISTDYVFRQLTWDGFVSNVSQNGAGLPWLIGFGTDASIAYKIAALDAGFDEYFWRGTPLAEVSAKCRAMFRRSRAGNSEVDLDAGILSYEDLHMNLITREVHRGTRKLDLRSKEFEMLKAFMMMPEEVLSRKQLFDLVWGTNFMGDSNVIEVYIRYLRTKIGRPNLIKTKRVTGYILISDEAQIRKAVPLDMD